MQQPLPEWAVSWDSAGVIVAVLIGVLTLLGKMQWLWNAIGQGTAWALRQVIWWAICSDAGGAERILRKMFEDDMAAFQELGKLVAALEDTVVEVRKDVLSIQEGMKVNREEVHADLREIIDRLEGHHASIAARVDKQDGETQAQLRRLNRSVHTLVGIVSGPEVAAKVLREHLEEEDK